MPLGASAGMDIAASSSKTVASASSGDRRVVEQQVELVVAEERQVVEVAAADEDLVVDPQHLGVGHLGVEQDLDAGVDAAGRTGGGTRRPGRAASACPGRSGGP